MILPTNSSLSVTLSQDDLRSLTTARLITENGTKDRLWLNGIEEEIKAGSRMERCLSEMRALRLQVEVHPHAQAYHRARTDDLIRRARIRRFLNYRNTLSTSLLRTTSLPLPVLLPPLLDYPLSFTPSQLSSPSNSIPSPQPIYPKSLAKVPVPPVVPSLVDS